MTAMIAAASVAWWWLPVAAFAGLAIGAIVALVLVWAWLMAQVGE